MTTAPPFEATLKLPQIIALYIGSVLGSGILIIPGLAADIAGPASLLAWGVMTVLVLPMALTMGLLSAKYPHAGGVSFFITKAFDSQVGSLVGWYFLMSVTVGAPVLALTGAGYLCVSLGLDDRARLVIATAILSAGLLTNYFGMRVTGRLQIAVVLTTIIVLAVTIGGNLGKIEAVNMKPFMPRGWMSVGYAATILYWCFIGWEAISHMSAEFKHPERNAVNGAVIAAGVISIIYFLTALVVVGTQSYGPGISETSLISMIKRAFGTRGATIAGFAAFFICLAPAIAYIGAASRLAYSLAISGFAPKPLARLSPKYNTPVGGLCFLAIGFMVLLGIFCTRVISMATLIQIPNATFILTYLGGCVAGIKLLKDSKFGMIMSSISLVVTAIVFLFVKWTVLYPVIITAVWYGYWMVSKRKNIRIRLNQNPGS